MKSVVKLLLFLGLASPLLGKSGLAGSVQPGAGGLPSGVSGGFVNAYAYDVAGNRISTTYGYGRADARGLTSTFDALNRVRRIADNEDRGTIYQYDANGDVAYLWQGDNAWIATDYDALGRKTSIQGFGPSAGTWWPTYYALALDYDQYGNLKQQAETYPQGHLAARTVNLAYDNADRLTSEAIVTGNTTVNTLLAYDGSNNLISKRQSSVTGGVATFLANITYGYVDANLLRQLTFHDAGGNETAWWGNQEYTDNGAPTQITMLSANWPYGTAQSDLAYDYEDRLLRETTANLDLAVQAWDPSEVASWIQPAGYGAVNATYHYTYDYRGRRVGREEEAVSDDVNWPNQPASVPVTGYDPRPWYTDRLTDTAELYSGGVPVRDYAVGNTTQGRGQPVAQNYPGVPVTTLKAVATPWTAANTSLAPSAEYIRGSDMGGGIGGILYSLHNDTPSYYHYDARGDVIAEITGNNGTLTYQSAYTANGGHNPNAPSLLSSPENLPAWGAQEWSAAGAKTDNFRANTMEEDPTGWFFNNARPRLPGFGGFLTPDPLGVFGPDGYDPYNYARNNPWTNTDPTGLATMADYEGEETRAKNAYENNKRHILADVKDHTITGQQGVAQLNGASTKRDNTIAYDEAGKLNIENHARAMGGSVDPRKLNDTDWSYAADNAKNIASNAVAVAGAFDGASEAAEVVTGVVEAGQKGVSMMTRSLAGGTADAAAEGAEVAKGAEVADIPTIGGRKPINSKYAGGTHPSGVSFNAQGFADFSPYSKATVKVEGLTGDVKADAKLANEAAGLSSTPPGYTWHHVEDGQTMQLVPTDIHQATAHTGGAAVIRNGGSVDP